jgi:hypothetical protein
MIAEIGIMVGLYIITRCCSFLGRSDENTATKIMAGISLVITGFILFDLIIRGMTGVGTPR